MQLLVSMQKRDVRLPSKDFSFPRRHGLRFEWLALLAHTRKTQSTAGGWVSIEEIQKLPMWRGKTKQHVGTNVGRYIQDMEKNHVNIVEAQSLWRGPYRLRILPKEIAFDIHVKQVAERLGRLESVQVSRKKLLLFTEKYARAVSLYWEGRLSPYSRERKRQQESALRKLYELTEDNTLDARLRLLANLAVVRVLDCLGQSSGVDITLDDCEKLARKVRDPVVVAKFFLANTWRYYRAHDYAAIEQNLARATEFSIKSLDSNVAGASANCEGIYLSAKGKYEDALSRLLQGLYLHLPGENFDAIQGICFNIGNIIHRMGEQHYKEAEQWLKLSVNICKWMRIGRYEAVCEIILSKIALESGKTRSFFKWIREAERLAKQAGNAMDIVWCHIMRAFYFQKQKESEDAIKHLVEARKMYLGKRGHDWQTIEKYLRRKFQELWDEVVDEYHLLARDGRQGQG